MKKGTKLLSVLLMIFICCFCFLQPAFAGKKDNTLNIAFSKELETLDRYFNTAREGIVIARHAYDNLLYRDPVTYEYKGLIAKSFKWNSDTEMEIILREGIKFHNGQELTADDVVYTLNFAANPQILSTPKSITQKWAAKALVLNLSAQVLIKLLK